MAMKIGRIFWGVFFLTLGVLLTLGRVFHYGYEWGWLWKFWPLLLVFWGLAIVMGHGVARGVIAGCAGFALGLMLAVAIGTPFGWWWEGERTWPDAQSQDCVLAPDPAITRADLVFESGAGTFEVKESDAQLCEIHTQTTMGRYQFSSDTVDGVAHVRTHLTGASGRWHWGRWENRGEVRLGKTPSWNLRLDVGAARANMDLRACIVERLDLQAGAATVHMKLGDRSPETHVAIEAGASSITIEVPHAAGCELRVDAPLSSKHFQGFVKSGGGVYRTEGFDDAQKKIWIDINAGVSSLRIVREGM
jgi:hypothetical protein